MRYTINHFINGKPLENPHGKFQDLYNPSTGQVAGKVALADKAIINQAVTAAKVAFPEWSISTPQRRSRIFFKYLQLLNENLSTLAELISREHGKTLSDAKASVQRGIDVVEFVCGIPNYLKGAFTPEVGTGIDSYSLRQPLGVCAGITPFNFPAMIPLWMFPMAIACGNTFVLKPSEKDPSVSIRLAELLKEAGLPDGILNVIQGDKEAVDGLLTHPDINAISFVGSTPIAEYVYQTGIKNGKRVQAFGGAKNHCIVMPDADLTQAAEAIVGAAYGSAGERCMAISVVVAVGDKVADTLVNNIKARVQQLKIGPADADNIEMGPLVTQQHLERVKSYVELGIKEGAQLVVDGREFKPAACTGFYMGGCLFDHVKPSMRIYKEEIFGPVLSVVRVPDFASALKLINEHEYGNGTAIFTRDPDVARNFAMQAQVGMIGINIPIPVPVAYHSFGGWKRSLFGDIHMYGAEGVQFYTKLKTVTQRWPQSMQAEFSIPTMK